MIDWKPIDTAPKDRRVLLFFSTLYGDWARVQVGGWDDDRYAKKPSPYWRGDTETLLGKRWMRESIPTHWAEINEPDGTYGE